MSEITQLRKGDIRSQNGMHYLRISPDAGTVKAGHFRDVPIHSDAVNAGFLDYVRSRDEGPLFTNSTNIDDALNRARTVGNRIAEWLKASNLIPEGVSPNHGWRHRFKTVAREHALPERVTEAICGHASKTAGDDYGDVTLIAKNRLISSLPSYSLTLIGETLRPKAN